MDLQKGIDLIISWPRNADYPLWRQQLRDNRDKFNKVIVVFTETNHGLNYRDFVRQSMSADNVIFIESPTVLPGQDWRDVAVNQALSISDSEWVFFTEQDFFWFDSFWPFIEEQLRRVGVASIGVRDGVRWHPCGLFVLRGVIEQTGKNFGIRPNKSDHFSIFTDDIQAYAKDKGLTNTVIPNDLWLHMAGLSHNMRLIEEGQMPNHQKGTFDTYLENCMKVSVPLSPEFVQLYNNYQQRNQ